MSREAVHTTCPYCGVGCGVVATRHGDVMEIAGDTSHPANRGRLCSKGTQLGATLDGTSRATIPLINGEESDWDTALDLVANRFGEVIRQHGPDAVAFYVSGQLLTEDYYVANKLMKGAIGSANIDTNSRLCMASSVAGYKRAFGADTVPCGYEDLGLANLVVLVGSNLAWCHPVLYQRLQTAREHGNKPMLVVIDPRRTTTAAEADLHLPIKPGTDAILFNGLLSWLDENGHTDRNYTKRATDGYADAVLAARASRRTTDVAEHCGLSVADVRRFYGLFASTPKTVTVFSQGVNQSHVGTDKVNAIINVHLATGRIGEPGTGPFSITGQPNAMGGREVGGLANQLAAHMGFAAEDVDRVQRFWGFRRIASRPGLQAVDLFDALGRGDVKAIWIMGTNPAVSMPRADDVRKALAGCEFVVVSDCVTSTDTIGYADVLLPAKGWGEKDGTVTNSERCISRQRAIVADDGTARADWWIIAEIASRMGFRKHFNYASSADVFREHAALSAFENNGSRDFDIGALADIDDDDYENMEPTYWPRPLNACKTTRPGDIFRTASYFTGNKRARFVPVRTAGVADNTSETYPLRLNTGRIRDQWHTMTRTASAARLNRHTPEPELLMHPLDAKQFGVRNNDIVDLASRSGKARMRARITQEVRPGDVFAPMHWSDEFASAARIGSLIRGAYDPVSGQPELKAEPVSVAPVKVECHGLYLRRDEPDEGVESEMLSYRVRCRLEHCTVDYLALVESPDDWMVWATALLGDSDQLLTFDQRGSNLLVASIRDDVLQELLVLSQRPRNTDAGWLADIFAERPLSAESRQAVVRGLPGRVATGNDCGETVCACFGTRRADIKRAVTERKLATTATIGAATLAGTNCGSCQPEIQQLIDER